MKYGTEIDFESRNAVTIFIDLIESNSNVLEFGAASGRLTKYLKEEKACNVSIVEIDEEAAKIAIQYAEDFVIGDIMEYRWMDKFAGQKFDYILFADVLEHLIKPEEVLIKVKDYLCDDGKILISLPNIEYNGVLLNIYKNKFKHYETGILDNTHLHFWALNEAKHIFVRLGFGVELVEATYNPVNNSEFEIGYDALPNVIADSIRSRMYGEVYQFIFALSQKKDIKTTENITKFTENLYIQCFFDFNEKLYAFDGGDLRYGIDINEYQFCKEIVIPEGSKVFRLDPLNSCCIVRVKIIDQTGTELVMVATNGQHAKDVFCFYHDDPQIIYEIKPDMKCLKIQVEYIMYQNNYIYKWICDNLQDQNNLIEQKENFICEQRTILMQRNTQIQEKQKIIEQKENYINEQRVMLSKRDNQIQHIRQITQQKEDYINEQRIWLEDRDNQIKKIMGIIEQKEDYINEQRIWLEDRDNQIREINGVVEQKENYINELRDILSQKERSLKQFNLFIEKKGIRRLYKIFLRRIGNC